MVDAMQPTQGEEPWSSADYRNGSDIESDNYAAPTSTYSGGQAWAADVAARRAGASGRQLDELLAGVGADGISVDTRPGSVYVQAGDSLSKIAARFPEYGSTNDLKNQLIAANPQLSDPNALTEGMELNFPGAGTVVDRAAMARAVGADGRYQTALAARAQPSGNGLSFDGLSFADLALGEGSPSLGSSTSLSGWQRTQAHALGVYDAGAGAVESAGYSFGVVGTPESRAAWAVKTAEATVKGIRRFANDPGGTVSGWWDNLTGDDPAAIRQATAQGTGIALGVAGGVAMGRLGGVRPTGLSYDIARWGEYGLPSDGYFARTLTREQYLDLQAGRSFSFGGKPAEGYPSGMGFIGSAEEVRGLTTVQGYREGLKLSYDPKYVLEFQLSDPASLQNVIRAPYQEFVPGGKTGAGFSEWNYPGISSSDIVNGKVRVLK
ncbi:LysM peptidoglycan-binding domain-containing protein [Ideonella alba]|uniref:LysM peptidoglycan-binding domain-containing protein n=1 Tax=Ideonella alba TaxID=2824118 RepID=A0A940Y8R2_9BURK|nr:LysM domain-containing protein [Ideonella alba]MBQ0929753.1 LysM peptidoglycan-binding domain-containing protein [Ideonella alba]